MSRQTRLDVPGILHHIILRGIEKKRIFDDDLDRDGFVGRMGKLALETQTKIYAWSLLTNHVHLLLRSGPGGLSQYMRRLLTGYAQAYNRRHQRKRGGFSFGIAEGKSSGCDPASSILFSVEAGAGGGVAFSGDWSPVWCFDFSHLPDSGQKAKRLIKIINAVPNPAPLMNCCRWKR